MRPSLLLPVLAAAAVLAAPAGAVVPKRPPVAWLKGEGNYTKAHRKPQAIRQIVVHVTEGPFWPSIRWLQSEQSHASSHFIVSRKGRIVQLVHASDVAWHAGNMRVNRASIGIEHEGLVGDPAGFTRAQYVASARLAAYYARLSLIPIDRAHLIGHAEVPDPFRPGAVGGSDGHTDPGPYWDWSRYLRLIRKFAFPPQPVRVTVAAPNLRDGKVVKGAFRWRARTTGPVRKVDVLVDGKVRLRDLKAPFGGLWETRGLANGRHTVALRAQGPRGARSVARFRVVVKNRPLVVRAVAPAEIAGLLRLQAGVTGGRARRVLLFLDGKRIDHDTTRPFVFSWNSARAANGRHVLELRASDRYGRTASKRLAVTVVNPGIALSAVTDGVWTVQTKGRVERVELLVDGQLRATLTAAPYAWWLEDLAPGEQTLTARVIGPNATIAESSFALTV
ncbi:MAG: N-acetylmuramoyl-L-alanine amidase [Gaiellaceae bacterium]